MAGKVKISDMPGKREVLNVIYQDQASTIIYIYDLAGRALGKREVFA